MNDRICGTCSICGGAVTCPSVWLGIIPPIPTCSSCGAVPVQSYGPVIPMQPKAQPRVSFTGTTTDNAHASPWPTANGTGPVAAFFQVAKLTTARYLL